MNGELDDRDLEGISGGHMTTGRSGYPTANASHSDWTNAATPGETTKAPDTAPAPPAHKTP